ncbi:hypothetical protein BJF82_02585 [Kytococcus sp. CUA-901]|nr:hypothetical protein BJF82_02585 [Kytococcus sp. CUA-901]
MPETHLPDPAGAQMAAARDEAHHGPSWRGPRRGTALCLSGGGFRAALFHLGALRRLNELGMLGQLRTVSAVSGGSIAAMLLADPRLEWPDPHDLSESIDSADLVEPDPTAPPLPRGDTVPGGLFSAPRVRGFDEYVAEPLRRLTRHNLRTRAMVSGFGPKVRRSADTSSRALADRFVDHIDWWARDLRDGHRTSGPAVVVEATELAHGVNWTFADSRATRRTAGWVTTGWGTARHRRGSASPMRSLPRAPTRPTSPRSTSMPPRSTSPGDAWGRSMRRRRPASTAPSSSWTGGSTTTSPSSRCGATTPGCSSATGERSSAPAARGRRWAGSCT